VVCAAPAPNYRLWTRSYATRIIMFATRSAAAELPCDADCVPRGLHFMSAAQSSYTLSSFNYLSTCLLNTAAFDIECWHVVVVEFLAQLMQVEGPSGN